MYIYIYMCVYIFVYICMICHKKSNQPTNPRSKKKDRFSTSRPLARWQTTDKRLGGRCIQCTSPLSLLRATTFEASYAPAHLSFDQFRSSWRPGPNHTSSMQRGLTPLQQVKNCKDASRRSRKSPDRNI